MARLTGLEPATPGVTGRYSNQLSYNRAYIFVVGSITPEPGLAAMARLTGLEPATPGVTGRYSNQLSYNRSLPARMCRALGCIMATSLPRQAGFADLCRIFLSSGMTPGARSEARPHSRRPTALIREIDIPISVLFLAANTPTGGAPGHRPGDHRRYRAGGSHQTMKG